MSQILNKLKDVDPNDSDAVKEALSPFFQNLSKHKDIDCRRWLRALEIALNRFPKYCMSQRATIETYLTHYLDSKNYHVVIDAAKCAHALQQVRPPQEKTATPKSCWRDLLNALCNTAHSLLSALFPDAVDIYHQTGKIQKEQTYSPLITALSTLDTVITKTHNDMNNKQSVLCTRLRNVFVCLQTMLVEMYPVAKPVRPQTILDVIVRALSVSSGTNNSLKIADIVVVKTQALRSLDALVACLGPNLIPFSPLVFRFVMQTLKWSSDNPSEQSSKVRCTAYDSLTRWLNTLHTHRVCQERGKWEDDVTQHILDDITPPRHVVELKMSTQSTKNLSKKAKRKLANAMLRESTIATHMPGAKNKVTYSPETNDEVAIAALECAGAFLTVCGIFLKPVTHKRFQERLVRECFSLSKYSRPRGRALLLTLECSRKCTPPTVPPPTQYCMELYSVLVNSDDIEISRLSSHALLDIRMHLHCSPPSLNFAVEVQQETDKREEEKRAISQKNRDALEAYLGADKVSQLINEEVITINDEPFNKKRKLDDNNDQISVSSESVEALELDNDSNNREIEVVIENVQENVDDAEEVIIEPIVEVPDDNEVEVDEIVHVEVDTVTKDDIDTTSTAHHDNEQISEDKVDSTQPDNGIYEAKTQMPLNTSNDDEEEPSLSMEVAYDYPNTGTEKVAVLEKLDGDNIPSSNETDDIQITCGQIVKNSQDVELEKKCDEDKNAEVKVNGVEIETLLEKPVQNGDVSESKAEAKDVNVQDMLADFVDEVNEDTQPSAKA